MLIKETFAGTPRQIGRAYGRTYRHLIAINAAYLVERPNPNLPDHLVPGAERWFRQQRERHFDLWPWLADEMAGIAEGSGVPRPVIERMNFRIWQYPVYGKTHACSSFAVRARDGSLISGGMLDDPRWLYVFCEVRPRKGFRYMTFPITGTCWGNRGMNEAGLVLNESSNFLHGLRFNPLKIYQQDLCLRVILQTCQTVEEVRAFCDRHPFFMNTVVADARGGCLAMSVWDQGAFVYSSKVRCLTNHPLEPLRKLARRRGYDGIIRSGTTRGRFRILANWIARMDGQATLADAQRMLASRREWPDGVNNPGTAFATIAQPEKDRRTLWVSELPVTESGFRAHRF